VYEKNSRPVSIIFYIETKIEEMSQAFGLALSSSWGQIAKVTRFIRDIHQQQLPIYLF